ncbi:MAG: hypothetical protein EF813_09535 [Methanosarcinales archaeon]|nr:MAG: hypothetical protein EF813_09535 [Methanosarcinales archaeon]
MGLREGTALNASVGTCPAWTRCLWYGSRDVMQTESEYGCAMIEVRLQEYNYRGPGSDIERMSDCDISLINISRIYGK